MGFKDKFNYYKLVNGAKEGTLLILFASKLKEIKFGSYTLF
jgi:hypothetical protein